MRGSGGAVLRRDQARAVLTWKPGHHFCALLVSGGQLSPIRQILRFMFSMNGGYGGWRRLKGFGRFVLHFRAPSHGVESPLSTEFFGARGHTRGESLNSRQQQQQ